MTLVDLCAIEGCQSAFKTLIKNKVMKALIGLFCVKDDKDIYNAFAGAYQSAMTNDTIKGANVDSMEGEKAADCSKNQNQMVTEKGVSEVHTKDKAVVEIVATWVDKLKGLKISDCGSNKQEKLFMNEMEVQMHYLKWDRKNSMLLAQSVPQAIGQELDKVRTAEQLIDDSLRCNQEQRHPMTAVVRVWDWLNKDIGGDRKTDWFNLLGSRINDIDLYDKLVVDNLIRLLAYLQMMMTYE